MKKIISIILAVFMLASLTACSEKKDVQPSAGVNTSAPLGDKAPAEEPEATDDNKDASEKPQESEKPEVKPSEKPSEKPVEKPEDKPGAEPTETPAEMPSEQPSESPAEPAGTLGQVLLADFKTKANMDTLSIAEALVQNPAIQFMGGAMPVEEGLLSGFDNFEVKGFKFGAVFMPMIGSIPFVGYVFELPNGADTASFIQSLRDNANMRWNICVAADEMVTSAVGNKVFFVMCPTSLGE